METDCVTWVKTIFFKSFNQEPYKRNQVISCKDLVFNFRVASCLNAMTRCNFRLSSGSSPDLQSGFVWVVIFKHTDVCVPWFSRVRWKQCKLAKIIYTQTHTAATPGGRQDWWTYDLQKQGGRSHQQTQDTLASKHNTSLFMESQVSCEPTSSINADKQPDHQQLSE